MPAADGLPSCEGNSLHAAFKVDLADKSFHLHHLAHILSRK